ncbi:MAG: hypothetical protein OXK80_04490 [Bdellovibrionales bacterium]|nr:hypothetical protein [Bdellovibrionales bacterium]
MDVIEDSELLSVIESSSDNTEAGTICTGVCALQDEELDQNTKDFIAHMRDLNENVISQTVQSNSKRKVGTLTRLARRLDRNLETSCGLSKEEICTELEKVIAQYQLPFTCNELVGLLLIESSGICRAINKNKSSSDIGLFQINTINFKRDIEQGQAKLCTDEEFQELVTQARESEDAVAFWKAQPKPQCISNPMYSLRQSGRILAENKNLFSRRIPQITEAEHQDLFRRLILSGYNGGGGHALRALTDLEIFNTDLQKKLSDGGKDITRSNRGILEIKREISVIDNGLQSVNQSLESLESNISQVEGALSQISTAISNQESSISSVDDSIEKNKTKLTAIPIETDQRIKQRRQQVMSTMTQEVESNMEQARSLVQEWNTLNAQDASVIAQQQRILLFLDQRLQRIVDLRRTTDPIHRRGQVLAARENTLRRFISEIEEEKWPYYMDQLLIAMEEAEKKRAKQNNQSKTEWNIYKVRSVINTQKQNLSQAVRDLGGLYTDLTQLMNSETEKEWDFYQIRSMDNTLQEKQFSLRTAMKRNNPQQVDRLNQEITEIQTQLEQAKAQRREDMENILNQNYRNRMSQAERARSLKILESEIEMARVEARKELSQSDGWNSSGNFFYPKPSKERKSQMSRLRSAHRDIEEEYSTQKRKDDIQEREEILFLSEIMMQPSPNPKATYLSALENWHNNRTQIDKKRKDLEDNSTFQKIKPFLRERSGNSETRDLVLGPRARHFYKNQSMDQHYNATLGEDVKDIAQMGLDSQLTSAEIEILRGQMQQLQSELDSLHSEKRQQQQVQRVLLVDKIEKLDQEDLLKQQREQAQVDLATSRKDPYNWEHLKQFYFAAELKEGIENSGLTSKRSSSNAIINITYVDALLGTQNHRGFTKTNAGKNICPTQSSS